MAVEFGLALQNHGTGVNREGMDASAVTAERLGWRTIWAVDHLAVPASGETDYAWTLEPLVTLAYLAGRYGSLRLATGVLVPPMRDAVQLAKELATLDIVAGGRLLVGVGVGDELDEAEYANLGKAERFRVRGAYLDETIDLWRHLWGGSQAPFRGRFHDLEDVSFRPLPPRGDATPIWSGGRSDRALARVGRLTEGYYASRWGPDDLRDHWATMVARARANGRDRPALAARIRVRPGEQPDGRYSLCGSPRAMVGELIACAELGMDEFVAVFDAVDPVAIERAMETFHRDVVEPFREEVATRAAPPRTSQA
jgi:probable F420-dependent oxidoreductase